MCFVFTLFCEIDLWSNPTKWTHFWNLFFQILMGFLHVIPCTLIGNLSKLWMTSSTLKFPRPYSISPLLQTFPPLLQTFPPLLQTFPPLLQTFPLLSQTFPLLRTHSFQSLSWDICKKLKLFHIQCYCIMSMYYITKYNPSIRNSFYNV